MIDHIIIAIVVERKNDIVMADEADERVEPIDKYPKYYLGKVFGKKELKLALLRKRRGNIEEYVPNYSKAFSTSKSVAQIMADRISKTLYRNHCYSTEILPEFYPVNLFKAWHEQQQYVQAIRFSFSDTIDEIMQKVNEQKEYKVCQVDYSNKAFPTKTCEQEPHQDKKLAHKFVSYALKSSSPQLCRDIHYILSQIDYEDGHIYEDELKWLAEQTDEMERANHEPSKIVNNFHKDSCHFGTGSSMNGDVLLNNKN